MLLSTLKELKVKAKDIKTVNTYCEVINEDIQTLEYMIYEFNNLSKTICMDDLTAQAVKIERFSFKLYEIVESYDSNIQFKIYLHILQNIKKDIIINSKYKVAYEYLTTKRYLLFTQTIIKELQHTFEYWNRINKVAE